MEGVTSALLIAALLFDPEPTPARAAAIDADIAALAAPRYAAREAASKRLVGAGPCAKRRLRGATKSPDGETAARAGACLAAIIESEVESLRPFPEADAFWYDPAAKKYSRPKHPDLARHLYALGTDSRPWANYYQATENWARELLTAGVAPAALWPMLADMHRRDATFLTDRDDWYEVGPWPVDWEWYARGKK